MKETNPLKNMTTEQIQEHIDDYDGFCTTCMDWTADGVEPDARGYTCAVCGNSTVIGAEEVLIDYL